MKKIIAEMYKAVALEAWKEAGNPGRMDSDMREFLKLKIMEEQANVATLSQRYRALVREGPVDIETVIHESFARAEGYSKSLDALYANIKLMAKPSVMLTFTGDDGLESCKDCSKYKGQRHKASWWISRNAVPPSRDFECHGYNCQHVLVDDQNNLYTI
jgi:hypothetical protein